MAQYVQKSPPEKEVPSVKVFLRVLGKVLTVLVLTVVIAAVAGYGACAVMARGPSDIWQQKFVAGFEGSDTFKFVPRLFFDEDEIDAILHPAPTPEVPDSFAELSFAPDPSQEPEPTPEPDETPDAIELVEIKKDTFRASMLLIHDPSLVTIGSIDHFGGLGVLLTDLIDKYGAIGGTNGAGFYAPAGGTPDGMVIRDGQFAYGSPGGYYRNVVGFDADHVLHVGNMTGREALDMGIVSGLSFNAGPTLVQDGQIQCNAGGGLNPRTALGQTEDGTVLLLVVEGRRPDSIGATNLQTAELMLEYGAVNAGSLDGGGSSDMYYQGEHVVWNDYLLKIPTAILVMAPDGGER